MLKQKSMQPHTIPSHVWELNSLQQYKATAAFLTLSSMFGFHERFLSRISHKYVTLSNCSVANKTVNDMLEISFDLKIIRTSNNHHRPYVVEGILDIKEGTHSIVFVYL